MVILAKVQIENQPLVVWLHSKRGGSIIRYGDQETKFIPSDDVFAAHEFGECVRHALECNRAFDES